MLDAGSVPDGEADAGGDSGSQPTPRPSLRSELVLKDTELAVTLAFAPDGRLFYNELLTGNIRVVLPDGTLLAEPFAHVDVTHRPFEDVPLQRQGGEWGLLGLALDPDFETNHYLYVYFTEPVSKNVAQPVVPRFTDVDNKGQEPTVIIDDLPTTLPELPGFHVAGNIHFGPDGYLYVSIGEYNNPQFAEDLSVPMGKILRVNKEDGSAVPDNPFLDVPGADPHISPYGLRNPFDFTFNPDTGELYVAVNGPATCDVLYIIRAGRFYGWPHDPEPASCKNLGDLPPVYTFAREGKRPEELGSTVAPTGVQFVSGDIYPALGDSLLACEFNTRLLRRLLLAGEKQDRVVSDDVVVDDCYLDVATAPNGIIYYSNFSQIRRLPPQLPRPSLCAGTAWPRRSRWG